MNDDCAYMHRDPYFLVVPSSFAAIRLLHYSVFDGLLVSNGERLKIYRIAILVCIGTPTPMEERNTSEQLHYPTFGSLKKDVIIYNQKDW